MSIFDKNKILVTHDNTFHADDIFATAALSILLNGHIKVLRTRDENLIKKADYVFDVGGISDPSKNLFDHHQIGGAGKRENGIPFASFGLVWGKYGEQICGSKEVADKLDEKLVQAIDAVDNGIDLCTNKGEAVPYYIQMALYSFRPSWKEKQDYDGQFGKVVNLAKQILEREIIKMRDACEGEKEIYSVYQKSENKELLIFDKKYPWEEITVFYPEPIVVVVPRPDGKWWKAEMVFKSLGSMERRKSFPEAWAGLRDESLAKVTGVPDAIFCHNGRFMAVAKTKEGAIKLAKIALAQPE